MWRRERAESTQTKHQVTHFCHSMGPMLSWVHKLSYISEHEKICAESVVRCVCSTRKDWRPTGVHKWTGIKGDLWFQLHCNDWICKQVSEVSALCRCYLENIKRLESMSEGCRFLVFATFHWRRMHVVMDENSHVRSATKMCNLQMGLAD